MFNSKLPLEGNEDQEFQVPVFRLL